VRAHGRVDADDPSDELVQQPEECQPVGVSAAPRIPVSVGRPPALFLRLRAGRSAGRKWRWELAASGSGRGLGAVGRGDGRRAGPWRVHWGRVCVRPTAARTHRGQRAGVSAASGSTPRRTGRGRRKSRGREVGGPNRFPAPSGAAAVVPGRRSGGRSPADGGGGWHDEDRGRCGPRGQSRRVRRSVRRHSAERGRWPRPRR